MRASSNTMPKKERLPSPGEAGTKLLKISLPSRVEVLHQRAGAARVPAPLARPDPIRLVNIGEDRAKATDRGWEGTAIEPGTKNKASVTLLPTGVNRRKGLKALKMVP